MIKFTIRDCNGGLEEVWEGSAASATLDTEGPESIWATPNTSISLDNVYEYKMTVDKDKPMTKRNVDFSATLVIDALTPKNIESAMFAAGVTGDIEFTVEAVTDWSEDVWSSQAKTVKYRITFNWSI